MPINVSHVNQTEYGISRNYVQMANEPFYFIQWHLFSLCACCFLFAILSVEMFYQTCCVRHREYVCMWERLVVNKLRAHMHICHSVFSTFDQYDFIGLCVCARWFVCQFPDVHFVPFHSNRCALIFEFELFFINFSQNRLICALAYTETPCQQQASIEFCTWLQRTYDRFSATNI